jgi:hypothetical protein
MSQKNPIVGAVITNVLGLGLPWLMDHFSPQNVAARKAERLRRKGEPVPATLQQSEGTAPPVAATVATVVGAAQMAAGGALAGGAIDLNRLFDVPVGYFEAAPSWLPWVYYALMAAGAFLMAVARNYQQHKH